MTLDSLFLSLNFFPFSNSVPPSPRSRIQERWICGDTCVGEDVTPAPQSRAGAGNSRLSLGKSSYSRARGTVQYGYFDPGEGGGKSGGWFFLFLSLFPFLFSAEEEWAACSAVGYSSSGLGYLFDVVRVECVFCNGISWWWWWWWWL